MRAPGRTVTIATILLIATLPSLADAQSPEERRWGFSLGAFLTDQDFTTDFTVNASDETYVIDLEDDLGLDSSTTVFRLDGFYRFAGRHRLDVSWFDLSRDALGVVETEFEWQDTLYPLDIDVETDLDLDIYKLAYGYEFVQGETGFLAATLGLFIADVRLEIGIPSTGKVEVGDVTAPLPVIGLRGGRAMSERWALHLSSELFFIDVDDLEGTLFDLYGGVDYRVTDNVAIGAGYNFVSLDVDATGKDLNADLDWEYAGLIAYLKFIFY